MRLETLPNLTRNGMLCRRQFNPSAGSGKPALPVAAQVMPTLELLKIMLECGHTDMKIIIGLCEYWRQFGDRPANLEADFKRLFPDQ
ncbi:hypothetical protein [Methylomonas sp. LL1]|uniref:hypothetical protein n=1 Tax=Methylomonas sp. LL1 TaxID=2785785 RepID=UPI0018C3927B|nr:hypothetical protein [Methylomonas sp. LL1]